MIKKLIIIITFIFFTTLFSVNNVKANIEASEYDLKFTLDQSGIVDGQIRILLKNNYSQDLIGGYNLTLPFEDSYGIQAKLNGQELTVKETKQDGLSTLALTFGTQAIRPVQQGEVLITFKTNNGLKFSNNRSYFYLPKIEVGHQINNYSLTITSPNNLGDIAFVSSRRFESQTQGNNTTISIDEPKPVYIIWKETFDIGINYKFEAANLDENNKTSLINLLPSFDAYRTDYARFQGNADLALVDSRNNTFAKAHLSSQEVVSYEIDAYVETLSQTPFYGTKGNFKFDLDSVLAQQLYSEMQKTPYPLEKLNLANEYLVNALETTKLYSVTPEDLGNLWKNSDSIKSRNSLEYCVLLTSIANYLELESQISYGYILNPEFIHLNYNNLHFWCEVKVDDQIILLDPYLQDLSGIEYFGQKSYTDRIYLGIWDSEQRHNNVFGVVSNLKNISFPTVTFYDDKPTLESARFISSSNFPQNVYSGFFYSGEILVDNNTTKLVLLKDLKINDKSVMSKVYLADKFDIGLIPHTKNKLEIKNLRETNFAFEGTKSYDVQINLVNEESSNSSFSTNFKPYKSFWIAILIGTNVLMAFMIFAIYKLVPKKVTSNEY